MVTMPAKKGLFCIQPHTEFRLGARSFAEILKLLSYAPRQASSKTVVKFTNHGSEAKRISSLR